MFYFILAGRQRGRHISNVIIVKSVKPREGPRLCKGHSLRASVEGSQALAAATLDLAAPLLVGLSLGWTILTSSSPPAAGRWGISSPHGRALSCLGSCTRTTSVHPDQSRAVMPSGGTIAVIWGVAGASGFPREEEDDKTDKYNRLRVSHV